MAWEFYTMVEFVMPGLVPASGSDAVLRTAMARP